MLSAAILIGGRARRLNGRFKPLVPVAGRSILVRQLDALGEAGVDHIALVGRWPADPAGERPPVPVVADAVEGGGSLGGLYTALLTAVADRAIVLAGDMPFVTAALLRRLAALEPDEEGIVPRTADGLHPLCACYRRSVARRLKARLDRGELEVRAAVAALGVRELTPADISTIDPDGTMLINVNTPADYERARAAVPRCV